MDQRQVLQKIYCQVLRLRPGHKRGTNLQEAREVWSPRLREVWLMISAQSAPFRLDASCCPFPSAQRLESLFGEVFWGFISSPCILISYLTEIVSSSRNQLSQPALAYVTASLLPPCPRSHFSSLSPVTLEGSSPARRASSPPRSPRPPWARRLSLEARPYPALPWPPPGRVPEQASSPHQ